jgi:hypothetical protein
MDGLLSSTLEQLLKTKTLSFAAFVSGIEAIK